MPVAEAEIAPGHQAGAAQRRRQIIGQPRVRGKRLEVQHRVAWPLRAQPLDQRAQGGAAIAAIDDRRIAQGVVVAETGKAARAEERRVALAVATDQAGQRQARRRVRLDSGDGEPLAVPQDRGGKCLKPGLAEAEIVRACAREQIRIAGGQIVPVLIQPKPHVQRRLGLRRLS